MQGVGLVEMPGQPGLDEGGEVWTLCADEHLQVLRLDVKIQVRFRLERHLAHQAAGVDGGAVVDEGHLEGLISVEIVFG